VALHPSDCISNVARRSGQIWGIVGIVEPISSGSLLAPIFLKKGLLPIYLRGDLELTPRQAASLKRSDFYSQLPAHVTADLESGEFKRALAQLKNLPTLGLPPLQFVMTGSEAGVMYSEKLSAALQLFSNASYGIRSRRMKWHMHLAAKKQNTVKIMPQILTRSPEEAIRWVYQKLGGWNTVKRMVVKTGMSHGSTQVLFAHNDQELSAHIHSILAERTAFGAVNQRVIVEPFIPGEEYAVNSASLIDGADVLHTRITDVVHYDRPNPPRYGHEVLLAYDEIPPGLVDGHRDIVKSLGTRIGSSHGEYKITPEGIIYFIENASRLYGAGNPHLHGESTDYGQVEATVDTYADPEAFFEKADLPYVITHRALVVNINVPVSDRRLYAISEGLDQIERVIGGSGHLFKLLRFAEPGTPLFQTDDLVSTLAQIEIRIPFDHPRREALAFEYLDLIERTRLQELFWRN